MDREKKTTEAIFIVGNSRSGTTLMSKVLGHHEDIFPFRELNFYERMWRPREERERISIESSIIVGSKLLFSQHCKVGSVDTEADFYEEAQQMLCNLPSSSLDMPTIYRRFLFYESEKHGKKIPCEQTPRYVFYMKEIFLTFPAARIVIMVRDPRDVLLSQKNKWKKEGISLIQRVRRWVNYQPLLLSKMWNNAQKATKPFLNNKQVIKVHFEELLLHPEATIQRICSFLGIKFDQAMLQVAASKSPTRENDELCELSKGISTKPIGRWKSRLGKTDIYWCERVNSEMMSEYGYKLENSIPSFFEKYCSICAMPLKITLAVLMNIGNTRSLLDSITRRFF